MKRLVAPWQLRALCLLMLVCCGCVHKRAEEHTLEAELHQTLATATDDTASAHAAAEEHEQRTAGPVDVKTTSSQLGVVVEDAAGDVTIARVGAKPLELPKGSRVVGTVPLAQTERDEHRAPVVSEKNAKQSADSAAEAKGASTAALAAQVKGKDVVATSTRWGPPWWVWLVALGVLAAAGYAVWRFKLWRLLP